MFSLTVIFFSVPKTMSTDRPGTADTWERRLWEEFSPFAGFCQFSQDPVCRLHTLQAPERVGFKVESATLASPRIWQGFPLIFVFLQLF